MNTLSTTCHTLLLLHLRLLNNSYKSTWAPPSYSSSSPLSALLLLPTNTATSIPTWSSSSKLWARRAATSGRNAAGCDGAAATGEKKKGKDGSNSEAVIKVIL
uniref:Candidate secreted effector n=1 Tax=Meloidogyne incognita TaxID=6306 RepID=A0A914LWX1_MELIC